MLQKMKPKVGLLGIMQGLYDESQPEIPENQTKFVKELTAYLDDVVEIDFPEIAKDRDGIERIVKTFNDKDYDGIISLNLLYSPGMRVVQAMKDNRLPVLIANIQPLAEVTQDWN